MTGCEEDSRTVDPKVMRLAHAMARDAEEQGAKAVLLMGSQVRGDSYAESDVDLTFIGKDQNGEVLRRGEFLVSISWRSLETTRKLLREPSEVGGLVPALRNAFIVWDPEGLASQLKEETRSWKWESISEQCDSWVAEQIAGYTEDVQRLLGHLRLGRLWVTAVFRNVISVRMAMVLAVHLRILYETENRLWDLVSTEMGDHWTKVQGASLGVGNETFEETCKATFELYSLAASKARHLMNKKQREAVAHTCELIGYPLD